ncbi:hypothetical protein ACFW9D_10475 [Streptomyces sp. NPDC059524]|uniref:hypothetical protein n=1 Tax=Streptomyces sp. NPDC059524 TaxID=3346856 RepID=UPI0036A6A574
MTRTHGAGNDLAPIYEELVRERGDVMTEAQRAAAHARHQEAALLPGPVPAGPPVPASAGPQGNGQ